MTYSRSISNGVRQGRITQPDCGTAALDSYAVLRTSNLHAAAQRLPGPLQKLLRVARHWFAIPESVLLFVFPELNLGSADRTRYDRSARSGMPPHVTLIYPFVAPDDIDGRLLKELKGFFGSVEEFKVRLNGVGGFPGVVYLMPEPRERFVELVTGLMKLYPHVPPYRGAFQSVIPHVTLAESTDPEVQDRLMSEVVPLLPIETNASEVWLMVRRGGLWKAKARFALAPRFGSSVDEPALQRVVS